MTSRRLLFLVTEDWYFASHRLPMARAAAEAGFDVHVATRVADHGEAIRREGFALHALEWSRATRDPLGLLREMAQIRTLYRALGPALVHQVALKPVVLGSLAATGMALPTVNSIAGLGLTAVASSGKARVARAAAGRLLRVLLNRPTARSVAQNPDDLATLKGLGVRPQRLALIRGSGVDTAHFAPLPEPEGPFTVGFAARMLAFKGVRELVAAHALLRAEGRDIRLQLAGAPDPTNPGSIAAGELQAWSRLPGVEVLGHVEDIRDLWAQCHVAALPSRGGEGVPKALLDAAACGRALLATDTPGCRDIVRDGVNGVLVPPDDPAALAAALARLADHPDLRAAFGAASRRIVEDEYAATLVAERIDALYRTMTE